MIIIIVDSVTINNLNFNIKQTKMDNFILDQGMEILEGRFRVIKRLGNGAFGEIYKVEKKKL